MNGAILASWVDTCAATHLAPLVRYLRPPVVAAMGAHAWRAVRQVFMLDDAPPRISVAAGSGWLSEDGTRIFAVGHPGPLGLTNRPWAKQLADWRRIGTAIVKVSHRVERLDSGWHRGLPSSRSW